MREFWWIMRKSMNVFWTIFNAVVMLQLLFCVAPLMAKDAVEHGPDWWLSESAMNQNQIYCPLMQDFWMTVRDDIVGGDVNLYRETLLLDQLNASKVDRSIFSPYSSLAKVLYGYKELDVNQKLVTLREKHLQMNMPEWTERIENLDVVGYIGMGRTASLSKNLFSQKKMIAFEHDQEVSHVKGFGVKYEDKYGEELMRKIRVIEYNNADDFILSFSFQSHQDECIIAKIPPLATFQKTVDYAVQRIDLDQHMNAFYPGDELWIPYIQWSYLGRVEMLENNGVQNESKRGWFLSQVFEEYQFGLDANGETWEVQEQPFMTRNIHMHSSQLKSDRVYEVDKAFLLMLKRHGHKEPYFAMWIYDDEFLFQAK